MACSRLIWSGWLAIRTATSASSSGAIMGSLGRGAETEGSSIGTFPGCKQQAEIPNSRSAKEAVWMKEKSFELAWRGAILLRR